MLGDRDFPPDFPFAQYQECHFRAFSNMDQNKFPEAENELRQKIQLIEGGERRIGRAIDKGGTYYDLGKCLAFQLRNSEAIQYLLMAYIEDALRTLPGEEDHARTGAAFCMLNSYFGVKFDIIGKVNELIRETKLPGTQEGISVTILNNLASEHNFRKDRAMDWVNQPNTQLMNKTYLGFPDQWEYRVFVGGAYTQVSLTNLYAIKDAIRRRDLRYVSLMGSDVYMREKDIHHHTLLLLHTSKWAIFDVNAPAGQLMEIERTLDYENEVLVVYRISEEASTHISFMIKTYTNPRIKFKGYRDLEELKNLVVDFLPKI